MKYIAKLMIAIFITVFALTVSDHAAFAQTNTCTEGDANHDGKVTLSDYETWRRIFKEGSPTTAPTQPPATFTKRLILHNWPGGGAMSPQYVKDNLAWLETNRDFLDGVAVIFGGSAELMTNTPMSYEQYMAVLAPLKNLPSTKLKHNFALVFNNRPADVFDDWSVPIQNWKNLARAVKDTGLAGIMFDNEEYFEYWGDWPTYSTYKQKTLKEYQDQTRLRGKQVMEAIVSQYPAIHFITLHGPYISEPKSPDAVYNGVVDHNELKGPFFAGFMEGKGSQALVIDGGEIYFLRTANEFNAAYDWQKNGMASDTTNSAFIPPALRPVWKNTLSVSYGIYNKGNSGEAYTPAVYQSALINALRRADHYVWLYTDDSSFVNVGSPQMGNEWMTAARNAKNMYNQ